MSSNTSTRAPIPSGEAIPEDVRRALRQLMAASVESGEVLDIYEAAGMPKPQLADINIDFINKTKQAKNPNLAIEPCAV